MTIFVLIIFGLIINNNNNFLCTGKNKMYNLNDYTIFNSNFIVVTSQTYGQEYTVVQSIDHICIYTFCRASIIEKVRTHLKIGFLHIRACAKRSLIRNQKLKMLILKNFSFFCILTHLYYIVLQIKR